MKLKSAAAIRHVAFEDLGNLVPVLKNYGFQIHYYDAGLDDLSTLNSLKPDLLIVLGGPIGVYEANVYPFLNAEIELLQNRVARNLPTLGICLGAQLIAQACGGKVYPGHAKEIGWFELQLTPAGNENYFNLIADNELKVLHWHGDTFDLPNDAQLLASSTMYKNQAFLLSKHTLGLQFHLETLPERMEQWFIGHAAELAQTPSINITQLRADTVGYGKRLQIPAQKFWHKWLNTIFDFSELNKANSIVD